MDGDLIRLVWDRAGSICEYCLLPQEYSHLTFELDHIIASCHGGVTRASNLALTCFYCNRYKGPNLSGIDPVSKKLLPLSTRAATNGNGTSVMMARFLSA
jgi:5-methylcytosine-specific restriction endonuclease McrA